MNIKLHKAQISLHKSTAHFKVKPQHCFRAVHHRYISCIYAKRLKYLFISLIFLTELLAIQHKYFKIRVPWHFRHVYNLEFWAFFWWILTNKHAYKHTFWIIYRPVWMFTEKVVFWPSNWVVRSDSELASIVEPATWFYFIQSIAKCTNWRCNLLRNTFGHVPMFPRERTASGFSLCMM